MQAVFAPSVRDVKNLCVTIWFASCKVKSGDSMNSVSKNIKKIRLANKLTQEELASQLFVTRQTVSNWETGKSQPDIDALIAIAGALHTDTTALIYGTPIPPSTRKERLRLAVAGGILLVMVILFFFLNPIAAELSRSSYVMQPMMVLRLYFLPLLWLISGWTVMQGLGVLGVAKGMPSKYSKAVRIGSLAIVLLYAVLMLPFLEETIRSFVLLMQYRGAPDLYPGGFEFIYAIPDFMNAIMMPIIDVIYRQPILFVIPGILYWLGGPIRVKKPRETVDLS